MRVRMKGVALIIPVLSFVLTGCVGMMTDGVNEKYDEVSGRFETHKSFTKLEDSIKEKVVTPRCVRLDHGASASSALDELALIDGRVYYLRSSDIDIPRYKTNAATCIDSFAGLKRAIEDTTNYTAIVDPTTRYRTDRVKIVDLVDKKQQDSNLANHHITIRGGSTVGETFRKISKATGYNVVYRHSDATDSSSTGGYAGAASSSTDATAKIDWFESDHVNFYGDSVGDLLEYLSKSFDLFYSIDYRTKIIEISKYKTKHFKLTINNVQLEGTTASATASSEGGAETVSDVQGKIDLDIYSNLEENIKTALASAATQSSGIAGAGTSQMSYYTIDKATGNIAVRATKRAMEDIERMILDFNDSFSKHAKFRLTVYELLIERSSAAGVDVNYALTAGDDSLNVLTQLNSASPISATIAHGNSVVTLEADSQQVSGVVLRTNPFTMLLRNHVPYNRDSTIKTKYIEKQNVETTLVDGAVVTKASQDIATTLDGYVYTVQPHIVNGVLSAFVNFAAVKNLKLEEKQTDSTTSISLPTDSVDNLDVPVELRKGERRIIGSMKLYDYAKNYDGLVPIENFIIGGKGSEAIVWKEAVVVAEYLDEE